MSLIKNTFLHFDAEESRTLTRSSTVPVNFVAKVQSVEEPRLSLSIQIEAMASLAATSEAMKSSLMISIDSETDTVSTSPRYTPASTILSPSGRCERLSQYVEEEAEKTTIMIRNIPNGMTQDMLLEEIMMVVPGVNFLYLPQSRTRQGNVGYAFVNFEHSDQAIACIGEFLGTKFRHFSNSKKTIDVGYATLQGFQQNVRFYRRSKVCRSKNRPFMKFC
jgi:hypothetical protein